MVRVAFWRYDKYPFVLGGHITSLRDDGSVETSEYGPGFYFVPCKILPKRAGDAALRALEELRARHDAALAAFDREWRGQVAVAFPWAVPPK